MCAVYGHNEAQCPDSNYYREPHLMEQLIPPALLSEFGITSHTPLSNRRALEEKTQLLIEVPETDEAIRAALVAMGEKPMICQEKGKREKREMTENKKKLQKIADATGKRLIYVKH